MEYKISECAKEWKVVTMSGKVTMEYRISKDLCSTIEEVKAYMEGIRK